MLEEVVVSEALVRRAGVHRAGVGHCVPLAPAHKLEFLDRYAHGAPVGAVLCDPAVLVEPSRDGDLRALPEDSR